ncbi:MAG: transcriptional repressor [Parabacteroides gordonii]|nr:transcriptional repressor [Parabacteroides gordonii]
MDMDAYLDILNKRKNKPTAIRLLVLKAMMEFERAFSMLDLENYLDTVDKSTVSRTINLFLDHHLIHCIDDGSGSLKYSVCGEDCSCSIEELHAHFYCLKCHKTFCLRNIPVPTVQLPRNFTLESINYVLKGCCEDCSK